MVNTTSPRGPSRLASRASGTEATTKRKRRVVGGVHALDHITKSKAFLEAACRWHEGMNALGYPSKTLHGQPVTLDELKRSRNEECG